MGAFLQANVSGRIFVALPNVYGDNWPEFKVPRWIIYEVLFFGNNDASLQEFKDKLSKRFNVEFLGQAHWYLSKKNSKDYFKCVSC